MEIKVKPSFQIWWKSDLINVAYFLILSTNRKSKSIKYISSSEYASILRVTVDRISLVLTLPVPCISESCIEITVQLNFYFHTSWLGLNRFYEGLKGLRKTFWGATKKSENKNLPYFFSSSRIGTRGLKCMQIIM